MRTSPRQLRACYFILGNAAFYSPTPTARPAQSVIVWGAQCETSLVATSPMNTTRLAETLAITATSSLQTQCISLTYDAPSAFAASNTLFQFQKDANNDVKGLITPSTLTCDYRKGGSSHAVASVGSNLTVNASNKAVCWFDNAVQGSKVNFVDTYYDLILRTNTLSTGAQTFYIGGRSSGSDANGWFRDINMTATVAGCQQ